MKIFISWSGQSSLKMALALKNWLSDVFQGDQIFMSDHDISAGERWAIKLNEELEASKFGILCITKENIISPWLLFEAGALSKILKESIVVPYLLNLKTTDIIGPFSQFQSVLADKNGTLKLIESINGQREIKLEGERLQKSFNRWWPDLENQLKEIVKNEGTFKNERPDRALLEEILELVRPKNTSQIGQNTELIRNANNKNLDELKFVVDAKNREKINIIMRKIEELEGVTKVELSEGSTGRLYLDITIGDNSDRHNLSGAISDILK